MPGAGLMLQRSVVASALIYSAAVHIQLTSQIQSVAPQILDAGVGVLLLIGLWTPVAGVVVAARELWIAFLGHGDPWMPILLATLGATLAMIGPGAWSVDAHLFGRRQIRSVR